MDINTNLCNPISTDVYPLPWQMGYGGLDYQQIIQNTTYRQEEFLKNMII